MGKKILFLLFINIFFCDFSFSQEKAEELYKTAKKYEAENNSERAIEFYTKTIVKDSFYYNAYFNRGSHYASQKEWSKALFDYIKYDKLKPNNLECQYLMASCYYYTSDKITALNLLNELLKKKNDHSAALKLRGAIYLEKEMFTSAVEDLKTSLLGNEKDAELYYMLAFAFDGLNDDDNALLYYKNAENLGYYNDGVYNNMGSIYRNKKKLNEALLYFNKAINLNSNNGLYYYNKGLVLDDLGFRTSAIENWKVAQKLQFKNFSKEVEELLK